MENLHQSTSESHEAVSMGVGRGGRDGPWPPWILKILAKTVVFLVLIGKKQISSLLAHPMKKFGKNSPRKNTSDAHGWRFTCPELGKILAYNKEMNANYHTASNSAKGRLQWHLHHWGCYAWTLSFLCLRGFSGHCRRSLQFNISQRRRLHRDFQKGHIMLVTLKWPLIAIIKLPCSDEIICPSGFRFSYGLLSKFLGR